MYLFLSAFLPRGWGIWPLNSALNRGIWTVILARGWGIWPSENRKVQMPGGLPGGGMCEFRIDRYIIGAIFGPEHIFFLKHSASALLQADVCGTWGWGRHYVPYRVNAVFFFFFFFFAFFLGQESCFKDQTSRFLKNTLMACVHLAKLHLVHHLTRLFLTSMA